MLIALEALFFGLLGLALALITRLRWWPVGAAAAWVLVEFGYSRIPFGGFGWTRIGYAVVDTPLAGFLPFVGVAGVSFLAALVGSWPVAPGCCWLVPAARRAEPGRRPVARPFGCCVAVLAWAVLFGVGLPLRAGSPSRRPAPAAR